MDYLSWSDRVASNFFRPEMAGRRVHLFVTEDLINEIGGLDRLGVPDFVEAVKTGPPGVKPRGVCQMAVQTLRNWQRERSRDYPPYIGYLALFVLAAGIEGEFASHAYYPRLRKLLSEEPTSGQYPSFNQMLDLWDDLEKWSNRDKKGELGHFVIDIAGKWIHVGLPLAQTILTEHERGALPAIFAKAGFDPASPPSDQELAVSLAEHGKQRLRPRTLRRLAETSNADDGERQILIETVLEELKEWDGTAVDITPSGERSTRIYGALSLCCQIDTTAGYASMTMRCRTLRDFPEDGLTLSLVGHQDLFYCDEAAMGWSSPISPESGGPPINASIFDWSQGMHMENQERGWSFNLPSSSVRILVSGSFYGLPGLVESRRLPRTSPFYLVAQKKRHNLLKRWGASGCTGFREVPILNGLPESWELFRAEAAHSDDLVRGELPMLALPSVVRLSFDGGVRASRGHQFFKFAPPRIVLEGDDGAVEVYCNGEPLARSQLQGIFELPQEALISSELVIEARRNGERIRGLSLYLIEDFPWPGQFTSKRFGPSGDSLPDANSDSVSVTGALVTGTNALPFDYSTLVVTQEERRVFFVGREPGQIASWPSEPHPTEWLPVWAIPMRRRGKAIFCGTSISESEPVRSGCGNRKKLKEWKMILWHHRKKIAPPDHNALRALWERYREEARRAQG